MRQKCKVSSTQRIPKARLVAQGCFETIGSNYSPVADSRTLLLLLSFGIQPNWTLEFWDAVSAYTCSHQAERLLCVCPSLHPHQVTIHVRLSLVFVPPSVFGIQQSFGFTI
eukprot:920845-Amphidinium_carterae.3